MKFLFLISDFAVGGISSALRNLTHELLEHGHEVFILNLAMEERPQWLDERIRMVELAGKARLWNLSLSSVRRAQWYLKLAFLLLGIIKKLMTRCHLWSRFIFSGLKINDYFDYAVAFRQEPTSIYLVKHKIPCRLKVLFWHCDPEAEDTSAWDKCINGLDVIAGVSNRVCDGLKKYHQGINTKTVYNLFDMAEIRKQSGEFTLEKSEKFNIVSVARIDFKFKKVNLIPPIAKRLKECGLDFCWTIVGGGADMDSLKNLIDGYEVGDCVKLAGIQQNPYPYIKEADLFVLTSSWESYGMVVMESLILKTPVVAGYYPALPEILSDNETGIIAENNEDGIFNAIYRVMTDKALYERLKKKCCQYEYSPDIAYNQFMTLGDKE